MNSNGNGVKATHERGFDKSLRINTNLNAKKQLLAGR